MSDALWSKPIGKRTGSIPSPGGNQENVREHVPVPHWHPSVFGSQDDAPAADPTAVTG
ncbi:hypothetical protein MESS4_p40094 [Mesorhizobium sp. STM 4661]|nr:hypothetical protein MESS4_p40094 [Mesorhizobium sp. STM 4661]